MPRACQADQIRQTTADLKNEQRLLARVEHLREIVCWADEQAQRLEQPATGSAPVLSQAQAEEFQEALELERKVLKDRGKRRPTSSSRWLPRKRAPECTADCSQLFKQSHKPVASFCRFCQRSSQTVLVS